MSEMDTATGESGERDNQADPVDNRIDDAQRQAPDSPAMTAPARSAIPEPPIMPSLPNQHVPSTATVSTDAPAPRGSAGSARAQRTYRSEQARSKAVYRRANPWWRRVLRALIGVALLAAAGVVVYFGVGLVQDFLGRDRLPTAGADVPDIGSASFQITSASPSPTIDGTLSIDFGTSAFEFVGNGAPGSPQAGVQVVSPDGVTTYIRTTGSEWRPATPDDDIVGALQSAIPFLRNVDGPDAVLENRLRQGSVELVDQVNEGVDDDQLRRYELEIDTSNYSDNWPLQWSSYQAEVVPAIATADVVPIVMTLDADNVVVRMSAPQSNWAWERLTYSEFGISIADPTRN
jgi:hypothetical protein